MLNNVFLRYLLILLLGLALGIAIGKYLCQSNYWGTPVADECDGPTPSYKADFTQNTITIDPFAGGNPINAQSARYEVEQPSGPPLTGIINLGDAPPVLNFRWDNNFYGTKLEYYDSNQKVMACQDNEHGDHVIIDDVVIIQSPESPSVLDSLCKGIEAESVVCSTSLSTTFIPVGSTAVITIAGVRTVVHATTSDTLTVLGTCKPSNIDKIYIEDNEIRVGTVDINTTVAFSQQSNSTGITINCENPSCISRFCIIPN